MLFFKEKTMSKFKIKFAHCFFFCYLLPQKLILQTKEVPMKKQFLFLFSLSLIFSNNLCAGEKKQKHSRKKHKQQGPRVSAEGTMAGQRIILWSNEQITVGDPGNGGITIFPEEDGYEEAKKATNVKK